MIDLLLKLVGLSCMSHYMLIFMHMEVWRILRMEKLLWIWRGRIM